MSYMSCVNIVAPRFRAAGVKVGGQAPNGPKRLGDAK